MCGARCSFSKELHSFGWLAVFVFDLRRLRLVLDRCRLILLRDNVLCGCGVLP